MTQPVSFFLDDREVEAGPDESLWDVARREGTEIPHLCHAPKPGYRPDGNCRACMVEVEGERVLAASCVRKPQTGMRVQTSTPRVERARRTVFQLLVADLPAADKSHCLDTPLARWCEELGVSGSPFPARERAETDRSHPAVAWFPDACIQCQLCLRACREVQHNDVIGMAHRGAETRVIFDLDDTLAESTCVACGECVQACPTGALMESARVNRMGEALPTVAKRVPSICPYCGVGCQLDFLVEDERIVAVEGRDGPSNNNRLCVKGRFGFDYIHHPQRLTRPLIRRDDAPKAGTCTIDPADPSTHFREASWEEALKVAANGFRKIRERDGGEALAGFGSAKGSNEEAYLVQKLVRTGFGAHNVDHCTRLCHASSVAALLEGIGSGAVTAPFTTCAESDVIIVTGSNTSANHPVAATFLKQAAARGATLIVIDPRGVDLTAYAEHRLLFRPGSDVALLNAMLHVIITEELYDHDFVENRTEGFEELCAHISPYRPEAMAPVCGIEAEAIRRVARIYARAKAAVIFWGMGISQHVHGTDNVRCLIALATLCGQVGRPGTGLHPLRGQNNVQGASDAGLIPMFLPDYQSVKDAEKRARYEQAWGVTLPEEPGLTVVEIIDAAFDRRVKGLYVMGENPAMSDPNLGHAREGLARLEHLVVQDLFLTETAFHADVVLPAAAWPEKEGTVTNTNRQVQMGHPAVAPPGDARQDWWIVQELARRLGLDWNYQGPAEVYREMSGLMASLNNISWERLQAEDSVTYPCPGPKEPGQEIVFGDRFPTASGRARLVPADIIPPDELPDEKYPMILITGRLLEHWHTGAMTRRSRALDAIEPQAAVSLSPADIERMDVRPGDSVRVLTRRGQIGLEVRSDPRVPEGTLFIPFCYFEAAANLLTNPVLDPYGKIPEFKFCAARVERGT